MRLSKWTVVALGLMLFSVKSLQAQFAVPRSNKVFEFDIITPSKNAVRVQVREGAMITMRSHELGYWYGFVPFLEEKGALSLMPFELIPLDEGGTAAQQIGDNPLPIGKGVSTLKTSNGAIIITLVSIHEKNFSTPSIQKPKRMSPPTLEKLYGNSGGGICCMTCDPETVCATSVRMECGDCLSNDLRVK